MAGMNYLHLALASLGATVAYFVYGFGLFAAWPSLQTEFLKYPAVYRDQQGQMSHMAVGMPAMLLSMAALAVLYAMLYRAGSGWVEGAQFGALIGLFAIGSFVLHNYVNLNIGLRITVYSAIAYMLEWVVVGVVIGLIYRPAVAR